MRKGFTLVELMIVIAIIAIIAAIAIPNLLESRITANENAAASGLKAGLFPGQTQFQAGAYADQDDDNRGEFGHLGELSGGTAATGTGTPAAPTGLAAGDLTLIGDAYTGPVAASTVATVGYSWQTTANAGYHWAVFVNGLTGVADDVDDAEKYYAVIAIPETFGDTGRRHFAMSQDGVVLSTQPARLAAADDAVTGDAESVINAAFANATDATNSDNRQPTWNPHVR